MIRAPLSKWRPVSSTTAAKRSSRSSRSSKDPLLSRLAWRRRGNRGIARCPRAFARAFGDPSRRFLPRNLSLQAHVHTGVLMEAVQADDEGTWKTGCSLRGARQSRDQTLRRSARWRARPGLPGTRYGRWCMERPTSPNWRPRCATWLRAGDLSAVHRLAWRLPTSGWPVNGCYRRRDYVRLPHGAAYGPGAWCGDRHLDQFQFSERENRHLGQDIEAAGGKCLLDMRVRPGGSHHQKFVVLRHNGRVKGGCRVRRRDRLVPRPPRRRRA